MIGAGSQGFPTALIGFGKMAQGYASDPAMARHFEYASHAQVLRDHPRFAWTAVVDPAEGARLIAQTAWHVPLAAPDLAALGEAADDIEVAVIATGPEARLGLLAAFPNLRAVIVEKPLGRTLEEAAQFMAECEARGILVSVNLWRRADRCFRDLAHEGLQKLIGSPQSAHCVYGNGLVNNGTHMVDFVRMLFGEVRDFKVLGSSRGFAEGPIAGDTNPHFALELESGVVASFAPLRFSKYRENGITAWGTAGRLDILAEGLSIQHFPVEPHRAMQDEREVVVDRPEPITPTVGRAFYELYENLAAALDGREPVCSPGHSALTTTAWIDRIRQADQARPEA